MVEAQKIIEAIDEGYEKEPKEKARDYIGASMIGTACDAEIAFSLRGFPNNPPTPRLKRIFRLGHILEDEVVRDLKVKADIRVWEKDGLTGKQHTYEELGGHVVCPMDGHIQLDESKEDLHVLEIKSMNDASWKKFQKEGVKKSHPRYYSQLQMMMGMSQMRTSFFIAINKNTSEYHSEIVDYDDLEFMFIKERIERVLLNKARKISNDETDWRCRGCFKRGACWGQIDVPKSCTTCKFAIAKSDGDWHCQKHGRSARELCNFYELYEPLPKGS